jgi:Cu+-exporting ATPase
MAEIDTKDENLSNIRLILGEIDTDNYERVSKKLCTKINGIISCQFLDDNNQVIICYDKNKLDQYKILSSIEELGYSVELLDSEIVEAQLRIEGMHCNSCVSNICDAVLDLRGSIDIQLTFRDRLATIIYDPTILQLDEIINEIEKLSFQVAISSAPQTKTTNQKSEISQPNTTGNLYNHLFK